MKKVITAFIVWRLITFLIAYLSTSFIPTFGATFPYYQERLVATNLPHFIWAFGNFDGVHYLGIAKDAYAAQYTQAFFPLYPLQVKLFSLLTFGNLFISAFILSNAFFLSALIVFYKLITRVYDSKKAYWAVLFLLAFPTSYYFGAIYSESLFLLLALSSFFLVEKKKYLSAAAVGFLASLTRLVGVLLGVSYLFFVKGKKKFIMAGITFSGLALYMLYLQVKFDNPLYFLTSQSVFGQGREDSKIILLPQVFYRYVKILTTTSGLVFTSALLEVASSLFAFIVLALSYKKVKGSWLLFSILSVVIPTLTGTFTSMPRYIIIAFPIYIVLASINRTIPKILIIVAFALIGVAVLTLYSQGYWVA